MPSNVIGLDVDAYGTKPGGRTLAERAVRWGVLTPSWSSSSRQDGISGIRLYRVPEGLKWPSQLPGIEVVRQAHRYAVVWPSVHPDTHEIYRWREPSGAWSTDGVIPSVDDLPDLPEAWIVGLTGGAVEADIAKAGLDGNSCYDWLRRRGSGVPCPVVERALNRYVTDLLTQSQSRHDTIVAGTARLCRLAAEGHPGVEYALDQLRDTFSAATVGERRPGEYSRALEGAIDIAAAEPQEEDGDPCDLNWVVTLPDRPVVDAPLQISGDQQLVDPDVQPSDPSNALPVVATASLPPWEGSAADVAVAIAEQRERNRLALLTEEKEKQRARREARKELDLEEAEVSARGWEGRFRAGGAFLLDIPDAVPAIWGDDDEVLWAEGEALMIVGGSGVGKTTIASQLVKGRLGVYHDVLGYTIAPASRRVLYLAMDRPQQVARALRRGFGPQHRELLDRRILFWEGPPPSDLAQDQTLLLRMCQRAEADTVIVDSLKDAAVGISADEVSAGWNRARQATLAEGIEVLELHHNVKRNSKGEAPKDVADIYGGVWLTAGVGSIIFLHGDPGDPVVQFRHLKQPSAEVPPRPIKHDHLNGRSGFENPFQMLPFVKSAGDSGVTALHVARHMFYADNPTEAQLEKASARLRRFASLSYLTREVDSVGIERWYATANYLVRGADAQRTHADGRVLELDWERE